MQVKNLDAAFRARGAILGPKGSHVHHIQDETGVKVDLNGNGESEQMQLVFSDAPSGGDLQAAMKLGKELLGSVYAQYEEWVKDGKPGRQQGEGRRNEGKGGGKGNKTEGQANSGMSKPEDCEFQHSIEIAECDEAFAFRGKLLGRKGQNVRDIEGKTGAKVQMRGVSGEPMRLDIGATSPEILQQAIEMAEDLFAKIYASYDEWVANGGAEGEQTTKEGEQKQDGGRGDRRNRRDNNNNNKEGKEKAKVEDCECKTTMDLQECDPGFTVRGKVLGSRGSRLRKLEEETGAVLQLHGKDGEPLSLAMGAASQEILDTAIKAVEEMLGPIYDEYAKWVEDGKPPLESKRAQEAGGNKDKGNGKHAGNRKGDRNGKGAGKGKGKDTGAFKRVLKLKECDSEFKLKDVLRGNKSANLHHIQDETRSHLWAAGEANEPVRLEISAGSPEDLEEAARMAKDLIKSVFNDYNQWKRQRGGGGGGAPAGKRQRVA